MAMHRFFHLASKQNPGAKTYLNLVYTVLVNPFRRLKSAVQT